MVLSPLSANAEGERRCRWLIGLHASLADAPRIPRRHGGQRSRVAGNGGSAMIVTVFRKRMNPDAQGEYDSIAVRMNELVRTIPGYVSHKGFVAADGEQVTIVKSNPSKRSTNGAFTRSIARRSGVRSRRSSANTNSRFAASSGNARGPRARSPALGNDRPAPFWTRKSWLVDAGCRRALPLKERSRTSLAEPMGFRRRLTAGAFRIELWLQLCVVFARYASVTNRQQRRIEFIGFLPSAVCLWPWRPLNR
jgi:hypothetical protein